MKACVVIPTYNESATIAGIVQEILSQKLDVIVIDDGSTDTTFAAAQAAGARVYRNQRNLGKGSSLLKGFQYILDNHYDAALAMDGDGQHAPSDIPSFIRASAGSSCGMVIGNRMSETRTMPLIRIATNKCMSWIISFIAKQRVPDSQCGFRLIKAEVLKVLRLRCSRFEIESEMILRTARLGFKIESVPIKTIYRNEKSRINPLVDTCRFFRFLIREIGWTSRS